MQATMEGAGAKHAAGAQSGLRVSRMSGSAIVEPRRKEFMSQVEKIRLTQFARSGG